MWKFKVNFKCIYDQEYVTRWKHFEYDATKLTWSEAWHRCIYEAIKGIERNEVIVSIESYNDIVREFK